jgi:hypothetical protein
MVPNLNDVCDCCGGYENQPILQLFDNKCFGIVDGKDITEDFCIKDFAFPTDGHSCLGITLVADGGNTILFNNDLPLPTPTTLESGTAYARGVLLKITYPTNDSNSEEILLVDKNVILTIETYDGVSTEYPLYNFLAIFTNPKSNDPTKVINKIEVTNPNVDYPVRISALVVFGNAI